MPNINNITTWTFFILFELLKSHKGTFTSVRVCRDLQKSPRVDYYHSASVLVCRVEIADAITDTGEIRSIVPTQLLWCCKYAWMTTSHRVTNLHVSLPVYIKTLRGNYFLLKGFMIVKPIYKWKYKYDLINCLSIISHSKKYINKGSQIILDVTFFGHELYTE